MHELEDDSGKDNYEPSDDKVIALMTIVVIAVTRGRLKGNRGGCVRIPEGGAHLTASTGCPQTLLLTNQTLTALNLVTSPCW